MGFCSHKFQVCMQADGEMGDTWGLKWQKGGLIGTKPKIGQVYVETTL